MAAQARAGIEIPDGCDRRPGTPSATTQPQDNLFQAGATITAL